MSINTGKVKPWLSLKRGDDKAWCLFLILHASDLHTKKSKLLVLIDLFVFFGIVKESTGS